MKTFISILAALVLGSSASLAAPAEDKVVASNLVNYGQPFIFTENGITFSVYPDGEFDFYMNDRVAVGANVSFGNTNITFNSGYNYDAYVQYDDYGAVIQVENIPVYYDYYGRVSQIGNVNIWYRNGRVHRIGGMNVYYNPRGVFTHYTGYVNIYNRHYVYRPWHGYFVRPAVGFCLVYNRPYRRYYSPVRYSYYRPYAHNYRRAYARVGHQYKHHKSHKRDHIYRNDKRVAMRDNSGRRSSDHRDGYRSPQSSGELSRQGAVDRSNRSTPVRSQAVGSDRRSVNRNEVATSGRTVTRNEARSANTRERSVVKRGNEAPNRNIKRNEAPKTSRSANVQRERTVTQRSVTRPSGSKTVTRSSSAVRKPVANNRSIKTETRTQRTVTSRSSAPKRSSEYSRSSVKKSVSKAPSRSARSNQGVQARSSSRRVQ